MEAPTSYPGKFETYLDKFLPANGQKCALTKCAPGWIWLFFAGLSVVGSVSRGWGAVIKTVVWEAIVGWGVAWLCRGCHTRWLWFLIIVGSILPIAVFAGLFLLVGKAASAAAAGTDKVAAPVPRSCSSCSA